MNVSRRRFVQGLALSTVTALTVLAGCRSSTEETPVPTTVAPTVVPSSTPTAVAVATATPTPNALAAGLTPRSVAGAERRLVWAWLRMQDHDRLPTGEEDYLRNVEKIDVSMPLNGGKLVGNGTWDQEPLKLETEWARRLPETSRQAGQLYMPGMSNDREGMLAVLQDTSSQQRAADELVLLATEQRFDAPWDGVYLDLEGIPYEYQRQLTGFLYRIANTLKQRTDLPLGISIAGVTENADPHVGDGYAYDFRVVAEIADFVDLRCYDYWEPPPRSIAPYWWIQASIEYALNKGIQADRITVGLANFSRYWPDSASGVSADVTYERAMQLVETTGAEVEWVEQNENGVVRESYAKVGEGHLWIHDAETHRHGLSLIDQYSVGGHTLFTPGMGDEEHWQEIAGWSEARLASLHEDENG